MKITEKYKYFWDKYISGDNMKELGERKIQMTLKAKWLQRAEAEGLPDIDAYIENLHNTIEKKQLQYEQMLSTRDSLYTTLSEVANLLEGMKEAIEQHGDLKIFLPQIEGFLQKIKT